MFIYSAKMDKKKLATVLACIGVVAIVLILVFTRSCGDSSETSAPPVGELSEVVGEAGTKSAAKLLKKARIKDAEDAAELLASLGWNIDPVPVETMEVVIPAEFSEVYEKYNELQKSQGFDLSKHAGKTATRWTLCINGHPSGEEEVYATLLVINTRVIGGDVCAARLDGFMHGLAPDTYIAENGAAVSAEPSDASEENETVSGEASELPVEGK
ncbi:MAG: DUF4830 domain-containing protein [Clostridia bacterium]|nr:DUF4830 domain-containing protein [Clostridia bacterium]